jgi:proteasome assembly chaperone (PAC2) family protein
MPIFHLEAEPDMVSPVLVVHLSGFIDAGGAAEAATVALLDSIDPTVVATFDGDAIMDHRARRPIVRLVEGVATELNWPEPVLRAGKDGEGRDVLVLSGPEPDMRWHEFCGDIVTLATTFGTTLTLGFGAFPAPVPHTRPVRLASTASSSELAEAVGFVPGTLEVPGSAQSAIERAIADAGMSAVGLWARVPHYVAQVAYPAASVALLDGLASLTGIRVDTSQLINEGGATRARIESLIANSQDHTTMVRLLEEQFDREAAEPGGTSGGLVAPGQPLPSADELAAELERFLRGETEA